jgi:hypothetical protein
MHAYDRFLPEWFNRVREAAGQRLAQPYEPGSPRTGSGAASGCSSPGRGASKGRSRSLSTKRLSASYAPPHAGAWPPRRKRWAAARKVAAAPAPAKAARKKRRPSPEGVPRIIAATKRRWAEL